MSREPRVWKISPARQGADWEDWLKNRFCALYHFTEQPYFNKINMDLEKNYGGPDDFFVKTGFQGGQLHDWRAQLGSFVWELKDGDLLFAYKKGAFVGWGRIQEKSRYHFDQEIGHMRNIDWQEFDPPLDLKATRMINELNLPSAGTIKNIDKYRDELGRLLAKAKIEISTLSIGKNLLRLMTEMLAQKNQVILFGPPGTGKTYQALRHSVRFLRGDSLMTDDISRRFEKLREEGFVDFVTFHPSYSYEEFVEGYKPKRDGNGFELKDGIFKRMCLLALDRLAAELLHENWKKPPENEVGNRYISLDEEQKKKALDDENVKSVSEKSDGRFVLVIDEINRANISKVLGELVYALEYRGNPVKLLYSQKNLVVPPNLYIIGTMNTADKSIALLDIALRRRFAFQEFMPKTGIDFYKLLEDVSEGKISKQDVEDKLPDLGALLDVTNKRLVFLADREKQIGHSYFLSIFKDQKGEYKADPETWGENLVRVWNKEIMPLLQEYFYSDYEKIRMILGDTFVKAVKTPTFLQDSDMIRVDEIRRYDIEEISDPEELVRALKLVSEPKKVVSTPEDALK